MPEIRGSRILIVEDEYLTARDLSTYFAELGAVVLGPASNIAAAKDSVDLADAAVLDIDLNGQAVFPLAEQLLARGVPFVFFSGKDEMALPAKFQHSGYLRKPLSFRAIYTALFSTDGPADEVTTGPDTVMSALPKLRLAARVMMADNKAADRLVEQTLQTAIDTIGQRPAGSTNEEWLKALLEQCFQTHGRHLMQ